MCTVYSRREGSDNERRHHSRSRSHSVDRDCGSKRRSCIGSGSGSHGRDRNRDRGSKRRSRSRSRSRSHDGSFPVEYFRQMRLQKHQRDADAASKKFNEAMDEM